MPMRSSSRFCSSPGSERFWNWWLSSGSPTSATAARALCGTAASSTREHLRPVAEVGEERQVVGADGVLARAEEVGHVALVDEERHLRLADDELAALLDLEVRRGEAPGQHVVAGFGPLENVDELLLD